MSERPRGIELDIYYPQYGFAIEVQELCEDNFIALKYVWYYDKSSSWVGSH
ncbi:hypothetical protein RhiirA4_457540 [Rhizophagus irregularis]|uniref:Uncharacterized protein n=1 Tax=Rhizophagus irregularis TaxID=588596 RepID=A0A2I1GAE5_9GLOM|nr:hypothetical protein RhiirA4_457540 [Rhizophagus irregularis]